MCQYAVQVWYTAPLRHMSLDPAVHLTDTPMLLCTRKPAHNEPPLAALGLLLIGYGISIGTSVPIEPTAHLDGTVAGAVWCVRRVHRHDPAASHVFGGGNYVMPGSACLSLVEHSLPPASCHVAPQLEAVPAAHLLDPSDQTRSSSG